MSEQVAPLSQRPAWKALTAHAEAMRSQQLRELFKSDPERGTRFTAEACGLFLDYSKNRITDETLKLLIELAKQSGLRAHAEAMFTGQKINTTEDRVHVGHHVLAVRFDALALRGA